MFFNDSKYKIPSFSNICRKVRPEYPILTKTWREGSPERLTSQLECRWRRTGPFQKEGILYCVTYKKVYITTYYSPDWGKYLIDYENEVTGMNQMMGKQSIQFGETVHILSGASIVGKKEGEGPLGNYFDLVGEDAMFGCKCWEEAESTLQKEAAQLAIQKANLEKWQIRTLFAGDLLAQSIASSYGLMDLEIPVYGLYGACSTMGEALSLGAMTIAGGYADYVLSLTSSHFASAEKEFRFPLGYGSQRPLSASWTVTGSGACVLGKSGGNVGITGITTGKIIDYGIKDSQNMGACMAPAACDTIYQHFMDFNTGPECYDRIITGDLGKVGQQILLDLLKEKGFDIARQHMDCGCLIFDEETQDTHAGGSGCGCAAVTFASYILKNIEKQKWKRILFVPTGALLSKVSFNEGNSIPGIAHGVVVERC